jgi:flagellar hook-associated protein 1 FlgK
VADGFRTYQQTLSGQQLSVSGVNIDEETINLIQLQRTFQANAKYISTISDLLGVLISL